MELIQVIMVFNEQVFPEKYFSEYIQNDKNFSFTNAS